MSGREVFQCRFCSFTVAKWWMGAGGKRKSGWHKLEHHIADEHPAQHEQIFLDDGSEEFDEEDAF